VNEETANVVCLLASLARATPDLLLKLRDLFGVETSAFDANLFPTLDVA
jgi:hypothetical protein